MSFKTLFTAGLAGAALLLATPARADQTGEVYIAPSAVYFDDDIGRVVDDGVGGGQFTLGIAFQDYWNIEGFANALSLDGTPDEDQIEVGVNLLAVFNRDGIFSPFLLGGLSTVHTDRVAGNSDSAALAAGIGFLIDFGASPFSLRADYRYRKELDEQEFDDQLATLGLQVGVGGGKPKAVDTDGDGVVDGIDRCPNTPLGATVDASGCELDDDGDGVANSLDECPDTPAGESVDAKGCPAQDSDGDGVTDDVDQCPDTPAGASVDANGCELDDDGDGVVNSKDRCPDTKDGARVDVNGCEITEVIELPGVTFETNSDRLVAGAERVLDDAAATLRKHPDLVVEVAGHTDSDGAAAYNESLSERRAKTVQNYLIDRGANTANLSVRGYGEGQPVADNDSAVGKAKNRRVELRVQD